ncbi:MAG: heparinase II/III family protein [Fimbriimonadaceae bacterium]|nr:heparinase II/III family protein [Fimbriimonadaceae bacterium]
MNLLLLTASTAVITAGAWLGGAALAAAADLDGAPAAPPDVTRVTPVSGGDAILEPWWDPALEAWSHWTQAPDSGPASCAQYWCMVIVDWTAAAPGAGPTLRRRYAGDGVALGPYTHLVLSAGVPRGGRIHLRAVTDLGPVEQEFVATVSHTDQHVLPLPRASRLREVQIRLGAGAAGAQTANLLWLGLRNPDWAAREAAQWQSFAEQPLEAFLRAAPSPAEGAPLYHLLCPPEAFRERQAAVQAGQPAPLGLRSAVVLAAHLGLANEGLFGRRDNRGRVALSNADGRLVSLLDGAQRAALAADQESLREVAKAVVQAALIPHWDVDFVTAFPDSAWEQRSFAQAALCYEVAIAADLAGAWLTPAGQALVVRRLAEDGLGNINFVAWRHPYIFGCNQLAVFSMGRLAVYALLEKQPGWAHVAPYTDLACAELNESLAQILAADGGFPEGTGYLSYTLANALPALSIYGTARGKPLRELLPPLLAATDNYLEVFRSTEQPLSLILNSDAQGGPWAGVSAATLAVLAKIRPGGTAARMLAAQPPAQRADLALWALPAPDLGGVEPDHYEPFVRLPSSGFAASTRRLGGEWVKLVVCGGPARAGHNHEDRGSFVLEFAGDTFAADPGGLVYADAAANTMKHAQHHNLLVPLAAAAAPRPAPANPASVAVIPEATGDLQQFRASLNPGVLWPAHYRSWKRRFDSPSPEQLSIVDEYERLGGAGVEFLWHTPLPVSRAGDRLVLQGRRGRALLTPPAGATIELIPPRQLGRRPLTTIVLRHPAASGRLVTAVRLDLLPGQAGR